MATNTKTTAHSDSVLGLIRGTTITAPASVDIALHIASTLSAGVAAGVTAITMPVQPITGTDITINPGGASEETRTVTSTSGAGPYTVNFTGGLSNAHIAGEPIKYDPGESLSKLAEPSGGAYARKNVLCNTSQWGAPADHTNGRKITNTNAITFVQATADWGYVTHAIVFNSTTGLYYGALSVVKRVQNTDTFEIAAGQLTLAED
jgi:hypothetical protein